ncbi:hypothetical protein RhiirA1_542082 [Rhizophagus irregularis]|uniref:Chromo domain-containing protein n=1 Tax=Rhizophagus irregularis TaxID=588596 RepID=A0A2N0QZP8_9GLOM|nr:hypothetical protein RhiirA1_542082 [Rhizophagus irregularis]
MILSPEQPPTYLLNRPHGRLGVSRCAYTRKELQVVPINEKPPPDSVIRGQPERFVPEQILWHRIRKGQHQYLVKWGIKGPYFLSPRLASGTIGIKTFFPS